MFNFFHSIIGKIAIGISSIALFFSGTAVTPNTTVQDATSSVQVTQQVASTTELSETQQLRKEVDDLKKQLNTTGQPAKNTGTSASPSPTPTIKPKPVVVTPSPTTKVSEENFKENVVLMYSKSAEDIKRTVEANKTDLIDLSSRQDHLSSLLNAARSINFPNSGDGAILNQMFTILGDGYAAEIKFIDDNTAYINSNINYLEQVRSAYNAAVKSLLADSSKIVSRDELIADMQQENNVTSENVYKAKKNILTALQNHYSNVIKNEDEYTSSVAIIKNALAKVSGPTPSANTYYQPMPQTDYGLTARQKLLLNPIQCTVSYGLAQTTVSCY